MIAFQKKYLSALICLITLGKTVLPATQTQSKPRTYRLETSDYLLLAAGGCALAAICIYVYQQRDVASEGASASENHTTIQSTSADGTQTTTLRVGGHVVVGGNGNRVTGSVHNGRGRHVVISGCNTVNGVHHCNCNQGVAACPYRPRRR